MADPLISVIVPIYNVQPWLHKCLDSLKSQTMQQIEIICIDDGSVDGSGSIADTYSSDPRFKCIHTQNGGLSAARNHGIDEAKAEWLMFVDGDDYVDPKFCEVPYKAALENDADLVIFGENIVKGKRVLKHKVSEISTGIIDEITAHEYGKTLAWNKLYKKALFEDISFPVGRAYEDIATTHKLVHNANRIILIKENLYYYVKRKGSISNSKLEKYTRDRLLSFLERAEDLASYGYPVERLRTKMCSIALGYLTTAELSQDELLLKAIEIVDTMGEEIPRELSYKQKVALAAWKTNKQVFYFLTRINNRSHLLLMRDKHTRGS